MNSVFSIYVYTYIQLGLHISISDHHIGDNQPFESIDSLYI